MRTRAVLGLLLLLLAGSRLANLEVLWAEETLPAAAALQLLHGKVLYRDVWFDKPPLLALTYLLWGAYPGWPLRVAGALIVWLACLVAWRFAREKWGEAEGLLAAWLLGFFLTFWLIPAVIPLAADLLLLLPHLLAIYLAWRGRAFWAGLAAGVGLLINTKAVFVVAACALWQYRALPMLAAGFLLPGAAALTWLALQGAASDYLLQVWRLGMLYAGNTFVESPLRNGLVRSLNWAGFHAAIVAGAAWFWWRGRDRDSIRLAGWAALSALAVAAGWRFFPRYYFQLLPVVTLAGARGLALLGRRRAGALLLLLLIPLARFGPRYFLLARDVVLGTPHGWRDTAMDQDSRRAALLIRNAAGPDASLFVWGFRPELYVYTRLPAACRFLESQPLTGVLADRHLFQTSVLDAPWPRANRAELRDSRPSIVVDGLGPYNPRLAITAFRDLHSWVAMYSPAAQTRFCRVLRLDK